jgi:hypothetical protein
MNDGNIPHLFADGDEDFNTEFLRIFRSVSTGLKYLGVGDAGTDFGAVEFLAVKIEEGFTRLADALMESAQTIADALRSKAAPPRNVAAEPHADEATAERELRRGNRI